MPGACMRQLNSLHPGVAVAPEVVHSKLNFLLLLAKLLCQLGDVGAAGIFLKAVRRECSCRWDSRAVTFPSAAGRHAHPAFSIACLPTAGKQFYQREDALRMAAHFGWPADWRPLLGRLLAADSNPEYCSAGVQLDLFEEAAAIGAQLCPCQQWTWPGISLLLACTCHRTFAHRCGISLAAGERFPSSDDGGIRSRKALGAMAVTLAAAVRTYLQQFPVSKGSAPGSLPR